MRSALRHAWALAMSAARLALTAVTGITLATVAGLDLMPEIAASAARSLGGVPESPSALDAAFLLVVPTLVPAIVAAAGCVACARWAYRRMTPGVEGAWERARQAGRDARAGKGDRGEQR